MGVYIPNMEMPKDGFITITVTSDGRVVGNSKKESGKFGNLDNEDIAKAVPVPPHGRLIDANIMEKSIKMQSSFLKLMGGDIAKIAETLEKGVLQEIANAPTIIPAEEGKS